MHRNGERSSGCSIRCKAAPVLPVEPARMSTAAPKRDAPEGVPAAEEGRGSADTLEVTPLGAGSEVGRSCILLSYKGKNVMLDCGIHPGLVRERWERCGARLRRCALQLRLRSSRSVYYSRVRRRAWRRCRTSTMSTCPPCAPVERESIGL